MSVFAQFSRLDPEAKHESRDRALQWGKRVHTIGARLPREVVPPTEETTGYFIPTLYQHGEKTLAIELAKWLASRQGSDGSFAAADGVPYTFDTAQVIRGFLAVLDDLPEVAEPLRRACNYVDRQIDADGRVHTVSYTQWHLVDGSVFSDYAHVYVLPPMLDAGRKLSEPRYIQAAQRGIKYFKEVPDLVEFKPTLGNLSHIFGYIIEGLVELGEVDLAKKGLLNAAMIQKKNGAIPAYPGVDWVCSTGMAQLAVAWYRLGEREAGDRILQYLQKIQNPSGGFYGSYGRNALYFADKEIGWAVKYFLDCFLLRQV